MTAGNSSPLTDGGACVLLMSEDKAKSLGYTPLGYIKSYAYAALDPGEQLLMGPVLAAPVALQRAGLTLADMDLVEMHEAFAAQVLCNLKGFESRGMGGARGLRGAGRRSRSRATQRDGRLDRDRASVRRDRCAHHDDAPERAAPARAQFGLMTVCAAGGMGFAMVVERTMTEPRMNTPAANGRSQAPVTMEVDDGIAIITFDLPGESVNKLTRGMRDAFVALFDRLERDDTVKGAC